MYNPLPQILDLAFIEIPSVLRNPVKVLEAAWQLKLSLKILLEKSGIEHWMIPAVVAEWSKAS